MRTAPALDQATHDWVTRSLARARYRGSHRRTTQPGRAPVDPGPGEEDPGGRDALHPGRDDRVGAS